MSISPSDRLFRIQGGGPNKSAYRTGQVYEMVAVRSEERVSNKKRIYEEVTLDVFDQNGKKVGQCEAPAEFGILAVTAAIYGYGKTGERFPAVCVTPWDRGRPVFAAVDEKQADRPVAPPPDSDIAAMMEDL